MNIVCVCYVWDECFVVMVKMCLVKILFVFVMVKYILIGEFGFYVLNDLLKILKSVVECLNMFYYFLLLLYLYWF